MNLQEFLNENSSVVNEVVEVVIGSRFKDENGNDYKFKIKPLTHEELKQWRNSSKLKGNKNNKKLQYDDETLNMKIIINHTIEPNFKDAQSLEKMNCNTAEEYMNKVLLAGEITELHKAILEVSGFGETLESLRDEVKN